MKRELNRRKGTYLALVVLLEWGFISSAALAYSYGEFQPTGIFIIVGGILLGMGASVLWSEVIGSRWNPTPQIARRVRLALYAAYFMPAGLAVALLLPLGWQYIASARPAAFALFRISTFGYIVLLLIFVVALRLWQASLESLGQSEG